jgi:transposase InsO family protein
VHMSQSGPKRQFAAMQQNARDWGTTRHSADAAGTNLTQAPTGPWGKSAPGPKCRPFMSIGQLANRKSCGRRVRSRSRRRLSRLSTLYNNFCRNSVAKKPRRQLKVGLEILGD